MNKTLFNKIYKSIKNHQNIVIARHVSPDPDAIASQISLRDSIKLTFPSKNVYAVGMKVSKFKYYGNLDYVDETTLDNPLLIVCDVPNVARIDGAHIEYFDEIIKIDHHPSTENFATINFEEDTASSTCQMITELILNTKLKLNKQIAENLYMGIVSDSDRFLLPYTSAKTFKLVSQLIEETNIDFPSLYNNLYERPLNEIKFQSYISTNMTITENGLGYIKITPEIIKDFKVDNGTASNMINNFNFIKELKVWTFITYDDKTNIYKINIRSRGPIINTVASKYNGGGHKYASGVRTNEASDIDQLIIDLNQACIEYNKNQDSK